MDTIPYIYVEVPILDPHDGKWPRARTKLGKAMNISTNYTKYWFALRGGIRQIGGKPNIYGIYTLVALTHMVALDGFRGAFVELLEPVHQGG